MNRSLLALGAAWAAFFVQPAQATTFPHLPRSMSLRASTMTALRTIPALQPPCRAAT